MKVKRINLSKSFMLLITGFFLLVVVTACGGSSDDSDDETGEENAEDGNSLEDTDSITFVAWGGTTQEAQEAAWGDSFTEETGITVNSDNTDYGKFQAMVESGNVIWDVVDVEADFAYRAIEDGLVEELDFSVIDKDELDEDFVTDHFVGSFAYSFVNAY